MEYIKKSLSKPTYWLLLGVVICLIVLVFYNRTVEHLDEEDDEPPPSTDIPSIPTVDVQVNELPVSQEALRQAIGEVYRADISAIKNLSDIANALQKGNGIKIPGKLIVNGETDLVGSKLTVAGETNLKNKLNVDGETSLKSKLTIDGETSLKSDLTVDGGTNLKSDLTVGGATNLASLSASSIVATDANKNLVSVQPAAALISYSHITGTTFSPIDGCVANYSPDHCTKDILLNGVDSPDSKGIKRDNNKLINSSGKTVTCLVRIDCIANLMRRSAGEIKIFKNGNDLNVGCYTTNFFGEKAPIPLRASTIVKLEPESTISFSFRSHNTSDYGSIGVNNTIVTIIGLY